jgi:plasmid stabilization system protein ParE
MDSDFKLYWTDEAIRNLESILYYLENNWSQREVDHLKKKLGRLIDLIEKIQLYFLFRIITKGYAKQY